jgi:hypothetical protein
MAIEIVDFPSYKLPEGKYSHPSIGVNFDQFFTLHRFPVFSSQLSALLPSTSAGFESSSSSAGQRNHV